MHSFLQKHTRGHVRTGSLSCSRSHALSLSLAHSHSHLPSARVELRSGGAGQPEAELEIRGHTAWSWRRSQGGRCLLRRPGKVTPIARSRDRGWRRDGYIRSRHGLAEFFFSAIHCGLCHRKYTRLVAFIRNSTTYGTSLCGCGT